MSDGQIVVVLDTRDEWVTEALDALKAKRPQLVTAQVHLLIPEESAFKEVDDVLKAKLLDARWSDVNSSVVPLRATPSFLVQSLVGASADVASQTSVLLPPRGSSLDAAVVVLAERAGITVYRASPEDPDGLETVVAGDHFGEDGSPTYSVAWNDWLLLPHAARLHELYGAGEWVNPKDAQSAPADEVDRTILAMRQRTEKWVVGDVWQGDLLPHMVHHGKWHGQRVDRLATELLRLSPLMGNMAPKERLHALEALSAAAWLHDVGQGGGVLDSVYVREYWHVRKFHGVLTCEAILSSDVSTDDFDLPKGGLPFLVGQLSRCHQRAAQLDAEKVDPEYCADQKCLICAQAKKRFKASLATEVANETSSVLRSTDAVALAAILRIADAADIGAHRVNGRWAAETQSVEHAWRRGFVHERLNAETSNLSDEAYGNLHRLIVRERWLQSDLKTMEDALKAEKTAEADQLALDITEFDKYLREQRDYVDKHRLFAGSQISRGKEETFTIELHPGSAWGRESAAVQESRFLMAADYIWGEYLHSEEFFRLPLMCRLVGVLSPNGTVVTRADVVG